MEEKKKLKITANKKIVTFSLIALALLLIVSTSYAYFTAVITGNDTAKQTKATTGTMGLKLYGNTEIGISNALPGESTTITFSVENTGTLDTTYALNLDQVTNNFVDKNDLVYTIISTNNGGTKTETIVPSTNGVLIPLISIEPNVTQEYTMTITFKETGDDQNDNQGKTFTGRVQINSLEDNNQLAARVLNSATQRPAFKYQEISTTLDDYPDYLSTLCSDFNDKDLVAMDYRLNATTGFYELINPVETTTYVGYENYYVIPRDVDYILRDNICQIKKVETGTDVDGPYSQITTAECKKLELTDQIDKYEHQALRTKLGEGLTLGVPSAIISNNPTDTSQESGMYVAEDNDGTSYYYRGIVENNYVSFANKTWRIVRINGDGTVRIILDISEMDPDFWKDFNASDLGEKAVGYTYDNDHVCTVSNPCTKNSGTNSIVKGYLETDFYENNLKEYDSYIAEGSFCNDTAYREEKGKKYYKSYDQVTNGTPSLKCNDTSVDYGGYYKLKIGLLTADEVNMAGYASNNSAWVYSNNYLYDGYDFVDGWMLMSPASSKSMYGSVRGNLYTAYGTGSAPRPVINLKSDITISSGDGTKSNPYVVE